jgi:hypothetical protein
MNQQSTNGQIRKKIVFPILEDTHQRDLRPQPTKQRMPDSLIKSTWCQSGELIIIFAIFYAYFRPGISYASRLSCSESIVPPIRGDLG